MGGLNGIGAAANSAARQASTQAASLVARHRTGSSVDLAGIERDLAALTRRSPADAALTRQAVEAELSPVQRGELAAARAPAVDIKSLALDVGQVALDIVGIFEPTPFADGANTVISLFRGDGVGALMSAAGMLPYVGDLAKAGKLGRWAKTVSHAVDAAIANPAARRLLQPALDKLASAMKAIPEGALAKMPAPVRETIAGLQSQIARVASPIAREVSAGVSAAATRLGLSDGTIRAIVDRGRGARPPVSSYMSASQRATHLAAFDGGIVRITSRSAVTRYGTLGPAGGFVTSAKDFSRIVKEAGGDLKIVEQRLGLIEGTLKDGDTLIAYVKRENATGLRVPDGNEAGANDKWVPGGYTSGNVVEAVMDFGKNMAFKEIKL